MKNKYGSTLVLILFSNLGLSQSSDSLFYTDSYHPALLLEFNISHVCPEYGIHNYRRADYVECPNN